LVSGRRAVSEGRMGAAAYSWSHIELCQTRSPLVSAAQDRRWKVKQDGKHSLHDGEKGGDERRDTGDCREGALELLARSSSHD